MPFSCNPLDQFIAAGGGTLGVDSMPALQQPVEIVARRWTGGRFLGLFGSISHGESDSFHKVGEVFASAGQQLVVAAS